MDIFWLDMPVVSLQTGVLIQYNVMRRRSTVIRERGKVIKSSPHGAKMYCFLLRLFYCEGWGAVLSGLLS